MTSAITVERTGTAAQHTMILRVALITFPPLSHHTLYPWQWLLTQGEICLPGGTAVKTLPVNAGDARDEGSTPRSGSFPEVGNGNCSNILAWKIPWTEEPDRLHSTGLQQSRRQPRDWTRAHTEMPTVPGQRGQFFPRHWRWMEICGNRSFSEPSHQIRVP